MAKLILLLTTLALFVLLANASIYRTTVELDQEDDNNNDENQGMCRRQYQQHQQLRACQRFIRRRAQRGGFEDELEVEVDNNEEQEEDDNQQRQPALRQCCNQLRQVNRPCVCPVLRQAAHQQLYQGQIEGPYQARRLFRAARNLPNICNIPAVGRCQFTRW